MKTTLSTLFFLLSFCLFGQNTIDGVVKDEFSNPIPFANIIIKDTSIGTTSNEIGEFSLNTRNTESGTLEISFIGFQNKFVNFNNKTSYLNITLKEQSDILEEVVLVSKHKERIKKKENPVYRICLLYTSPSPRDA